VFSYEICVVCSSSIYGFWLPLWYLQTLLPMKICIHWIISFILEFNVNLFICYKYYYYAIRRRYMHVQTCAFRYRCTTKELRHIHIITKQPETWNELQNVKILQKLWISLPVNIEDYGLWYLTPLYFHNIFSYFVAVSFIGGWNRSKPPTLRRSQINIMLYRVHLAMKEIRNHNFSGDGYWLHR
jgi:hypothetical protein